MALFQAYVNKLISLEEALGRSTDVKELEGMLEKVGVRTVVCDLAKGDFSALPDDFDYLLHLATFQGGGLDYDQAIRVPERLH